MVVLITKAVLLTVIVMLVHFKKTKTRKNIKMMIFTVTVDNPFLYIDDNYNVQPLVRSTVLCHFPTLTKLFVMLN